MATPSASHFAVLERAPLESGRALKLLRSFIKQHSATLGDAADAAGTSRPSLAVRAARPSSSHCAGLAVAAAVDAA
jgi:hypothetical protein